MPGLFVLVTLVLSVPACLSQSSGSETPSGASTVWQTLQSVSTSLCEDGHGFLVSLFGRQSVDSGLKTVGQLTTWTSEAAAAGLNTLAGYVSELLGAAGITASLPVKRITPEGVVFVTKWALLALLAYWILSLAACFVAGILRRTLWLLKITFAIAMFGLILSDTGATAETTAMRLAGLVLACVLLGIGPSPFRGDGNAHMEAKVKVLERRLRELEKKSKEE
ncbi:voltage-gated monoatomic cation channel TMEM109 [Salminus brasiliensis]|uniref:voltage-gated monoatomic cation channel TMEM109 n=1 Tax=Salminus brasiliensis TaxID=930266 RepID=UPI003B837A22